jgi:hypothetical protein
MDPDPHQKEAGKMFFAAAETRVHVARQGSAERLFSAVAAGARLVVKSARRTGSHNRKVIRFGLVLLAPRWQQVAVKTGRRG